VHPDRSDVHGGAGDLAVEVERDAFVGLEPERERVAFQAGAALGGKEDVRSGTELDADFTGALGEPLSAAQKERDAGPPPVVDGDAQGDEGFDLGIRGDPGFLAVGGRGLAVR
jgi:hypothetical protein